VHQGEDGSVARMCNILNFKVFHIVREGNRCVYGLTNLGVESKIELVWLDVHPSCISSDSFRNRLSLPNYKFS